MASAVSTSLFTNAVITSYSIHYTKLYDIKGKVVDMIHVDHVKVTCFIVTKKKDEMLSQLRKLHHGITCLHSEGGYSEEDNYMLMTVTTRYEVPSVRKTVMTTDPKAFMNVVQSTEILGRFRRPRR